MSDFNTRDYETGYKDGLRSAEASTTALRAEVERLTGERDRQYDQNAEQIIRIAALEAENERLKGFEAANRLNAAQVKAQRAEVERLRAALEPFAIKISARRQASIRSAKGDSMTDITIPDEALEAVAKVLHDHAEIFDDVPWEDLSGADQEAYMDEARAACLAMLEAWPWKKHGIHHRHDVSIPFVMLSMAEVPNDND